MIFVVEFNICEVGRPHPHIPHLCYIRIDLLFKDLPRFRGEYFHIFNYFGSFNVLSIPEHNNLNLLARIIRPNILGHSIDRAHIELEFCERQIIDDYLSMQLVLPLVVGYAIGHLLILVVSNQKDVIKILCDGFLKIFYLLSREYSVICGRFNTEGFFEENINILLCILNGLHSDVKTELFSFPLEFSYPLTLLLFLFLFFLLLPFLNDIL